MLKKFGVAYGADPEGFFEQEGRVVGSEKLIPKKGIGTQFGKITRDGVQFELHPAPGSIRDLAKNVGGLLLTAISEARDEGYSLNYSTLVEVSKEELQSLSRECQVLGCQPSYNIYEERPITVDTEAYRKRSAAGHIHVGLGDKQLLRMREKLIPIMDIVVGNTCVLLDRDPGAAERRENYGRSGECRFPKHGVEYRTISNFWLRDPSLMLFTFGLAEIAVAIFADTAFGSGETWHRIPEHIKLENVRQAIDTNDFGLALRNFNSLVPLLRDALPKNHFVLDADRMGTFVNLAIAINRKGLDTYFPLERLSQRWRKFNNLDLLSVKV